jgi:hypothetical protein
LFAVAADVLTLGVHVKKVTENTAINAAAIAHPVAFMVSPYFSSSPSESPTLQIYIAPDINANNSVYSVKSLDFDTAMIYIGTVSSEITVTGDAPLRGAD